MTRGTGDSIIPRVTSDPPHILFAEPYDDEAVDAMRRAGRVTVLPDCAPRTLGKAIADCDALLVRSYAIVDDDLLARAKRLRVIARGGVGLDNIDVNAARRRGIEVVYTPAAATDAVADLVVGQMIALTRGVVDADRAVRDGTFIETRNAARAPELRDLTLGIIGMGRIGRAVGRRCRIGFEMRVRYHDIVSPGLLDFVAEPRALDALLAEADVITLHVPLTDRTNRMIDAEAIARMKPGAVLINTARGAVVDSAALASALAEGRLAGAAVDVFDPEPPSPDDPLLRAPRILLTPHLGSRTRNALHNMNAVVEDVARVLDGSPPLFPAPSDADDVDNRRSANHDAPIGG